MESARQKPLLQETAGAMPDHIGAEDAAQAALEAAFCALRAESAALWLTDPGAPQTICALLYRGTEEAEARWVITDHLLLSWDAPCQFADKRGDDGAPVRKAYAPLLRQGRLIGGIYVARADIFREAECHLLNAICVEAATALDHARLALSDQSPSPRPEPA